MPKLLDAFECGMLGRDSPGPRSCHCGNAFVEMGRMAKNYAIYMT